MPVTVISFAVPPPSRTVEPVTAMKVLLPRPAPNDTLPVMVPALVNVLPELEASNATRPSMVPVLTIVILSPPVTATASTSPMPSETVSGVPPKMPELRICVQPKAPLRTSSAMPVRAGRLVPLEANTPLSTPSFVMSKMLLLALPSMTPDVAAKAFPIEGSTVPRLMKVVLLPLSVIALGELVAAVTRAPGSTVRYKLFVPDVTPSIAPEQLTCTPGLNAPQAAWAMAGRPAIRPAAASANASLVNRDRARPAGATAADAPPPSCARAVSGAATHAPSA
ncbi:hypothetical protein D3C86_1204040 [compost metagenome]